QRHSARIVVCGGPCKTGRHILGYMGQSIPAIFDAGVFRPLAPVDLANGTPVQVQVLPMSGDSGSSATPGVLSQHSQIEAMLSEIEQLPIEEPEDGFSGRDHDRVLYGK
ncbi:MAG: antitoxin family protein, partial [Pirellulales bacterium]